MSANSIAADKTGPAPQTHTIRFALLLAAASLAPLFWLGQMLLSYAITSYACYPGDHPVEIRYGAALSQTLWAFDAVALASALAGGVLAWRQLRRARKVHPAAQHHRTIAVRTHFLALWGCFSSIIFFCAILFNIIASIAVPPCVG
jgi:hypothetical protein